MIRPDATLIWLSVRALQAPTYAERQHDSDVAEQERLVRCVSSRVIRQARPPVLEAVSEQSAGLQAADLELLHYWQIQFTTSIRAKNPTL